MMRQSPERTRPDPDIRLCSRWRRAESEVSGLQISALSRSGSVADLRLAFAIRFAVWIGRPWQVLFGLPVIQDLFGRCPLTIIEP
jgi:hypothetical protein